MKVVILTEEYRGFPKNTELTFLNDSDADNLIGDGIALPKSIDDPPRDKMVRKRKTK